MKLFILFCTLFSLNAFSSYSKEKYWLRLCGFGYYQYKLNGWQKQIGDIKYILIKDGTPLIGYSDNGIFFKEKKICDWKEVSRYPKDIKKYKQSVCPPGTPIEFSELNEEESRQFGSDDKFLIKLQVDELWIQFDKLDELRSNEEFISKINFAGDTFELPVDKACERNGDYSELLVKRLLKDKEFSTFFNTTINCFQKYPFCRDINEIKKEIGDRSIDEFSISQKMIHYFDDLKKKAPAMAEVHLSGNKIEVEFIPLSFDVSSVVIQQTIKAVFKKERKFVEGKNIKEQPKYGSWKLELQINGD